ncbi:MAG: radical SAM family heme chaperone HemW [Lachnospiraceae bacterium]|nr:radical SAM family heme chaperone HemW [Lachnospiraceae bacterium]
MEQAKKETEKPKKSNDISIYVHIPFCVRKCPYCDFNSGVPSSEDTFFYYTDAILKELDLNSELLAGRKLVSVYIGGGTPSVMPSMCMGRILDRISDIIHVDDDTEITMEVNPGTVNKYKINDYVKMGINRISLGGQSAVDEELRALGRIHTAKDLKEAFDMFYWGGIDNISVDIMTSIPYQTPDSLITTLDTVTGLHPRHISAYSLIIEQGTPFYDKYMYGNLALPSEEDSYYLYKLAQQYLTSKDYKRYEISNYAIYDGKGASSGKDFRCVHNLRYWSRGDYLGVGLSAASLIGDHRFTNTNELESYVSAPGRFRSEDMILQTTDAMAEFMFLGLRKTDGFMISDFERDFGMPIDEVYGAVMRRHIDAGVAERVKEEDDERFYLTDTGLDVSNQVMCEYLF